LDFKKKTDKKFILVIGERLTKLQIKNHSARGKSTKSLDEIRRNVVQRYMKKYYKIPKVTGSPIFVGYSRATICHHSVRKLDFLVPDIITHKPDQRDFFKK
jgi:hypothetical protein